MPIQSSTNLGGSGRLVGLTNISANSKEEEEMSTTIFTIRHFSHGPTNQELQKKPSKSKPIQIRLSIITACSKSNKPESSSSSSSIGFTKRCTVLGSGLLFCLGSPRDGSAVTQGLLAGRIPGLSEPDETGWRTYRRPDEKSGGHGVGWSPITPYTFDVPQEWEEVPVSIADLGGTEIDLRFGNAKEGRAIVVVAPVLRFTADLGDNVTIEAVGTPEKVINAFGPEVIGESVEGKVLSMNVEEHSGRTYYKFELEPPHIFIIATAAGNRLYLFCTTGNGLQWKKHNKSLKRIADSFRVI